WAAAPVERRRRRSAVETVGSRSARRSPADLPPLATPTSCESCVATRLGRRDAPRPAEVPPTEAIRCSRIAATVGTTPTPARAPHPDLDANRDGWRSGRPTAKTRTWQPPPEARCRDRPVRPTHGPEQRPEP